MGWWVIEGVDGAGKSTLVAKLTAQLKWITPGCEVDVRHHSQLKQDPLIEYEKGYDDYRPGSGKHIISDRWAWGEDVYGPLYRGKSQLTFAARTHVEKYAQSRGALPILMTHDADVLRQRFLDRGEDYLKDKHIETVIRGFDAVRDRSLLSEATWTCKDPDDYIVTQLVVAGLRQEEIAAKLNLYPTYVGPFFPDGLLLGERRNDPSWKAAFVPGGATSGRFLIDALPPSYLPKIGLANALEEPVKLLWEQLGRPDVVALGRKAESVCREAQLPFVPVPHPQYVRRFHNRKNLEYGHAIIRALSGKVVNFP